MVKVTDKDLQKKEERTAAWQKGLTPEGRVPEKRLMQMLRSAVRKVWMHSPVKLLKLETAVYPDTNPNTRTKWLVKCEQCGKEFKKTEVEVDHINGGHSLKRIEDLPEFFGNLLDVTVDDLQVLCKECHSIKTYSETHGMSMENAKIEKDVVAWFKAHPKVSEQKSILRQHGCSDEQISNEVKRKMIVRTWYSIRSES